MLELDEIRAKGIALWESGLVLQGWMGKVPLFPLEIPLESASQPASLSQLQHASQMLEEAGKCYVGQGYRIEYQDVIAVAEGQRRLPGKVVFDEPLDLISFIGREDEFQRFARTAREIRRRFPGLEAWVRQYPMKVLAQNDRWPYILDALDVALASGQDFSGSPDQLPLSSQERLLLNELMRVLWAE